MDEYEKLVPCPGGCKIVHTGTSNHQRKGQDYDSYFFDVVNEAGDVIEKHEVRDSTSINPPHKREIFLHK